MPCANYEAVAVGLDGMMHTNREGPSSHLNHLAPPDCKRQISSDLPRFENNEAYRSFQQSGPHQKCGKAGIRVTRGREEGQPQELARWRKRDRLPRAIMFRFEAELATVAILAIHGRPLDSSPARSQQRSGDIDDVVAAVISSLIQARRARS